MSAAFSTLFVQIIGQKEIKNDRFLTMVGTLSSVANMLGRLMWGELADRVFYKVSYPIEHFIK